MATAMWLRAGHEPWASSNSMCPSFPHALSPNPIPASPSVNPLAEGGSRGLASQNLQFKAPICHSAGRLRVSMSKQDFSWHFQSSFLTVSQWCTDGWSPASFSTALTLSGCERKDKLKKKLVCPFQITSPWPPWKTWFIKTNKGSERETVRSYEKTNWVSTTLRT